MYSVFLAAFFFTGGYIFVGVCVGKWFLLESYLGGAAGEGGSLHGSTWGGYYKRG